MDFNEICLEIVNTLYSINEKYQKGELSQNEANIMYKKLLINIHNVIKRIQQSNMLSGNRKSLYISHLVRLKYEALDKVSETETCVEI